MKLEKCYHFGCHVFVVEIRIDYKIKDISKVRQPPCNLLQNVQTFRPEPRLKREVCDGTAADL
jgi:hypothetical protein